MNSWWVSVTFSEFIFGNGWTTESWRLFFQIHTEFLEEISKAFEILVFNLCFNI